MTAFAASMASVSMPMPPIPRHIIITHEEDAVEVSNGKENSKNNNKPTMPFNLPLVDEIDLQQCLVSPSQPWRASSIQGVLIGKERLEVICKATGGSPGRNNAAAQQSHIGTNAIQACPCCRRYIQLDSRAKIESGDDAVENQQEGDQPQAQQHNEASEELNNDHDFTTRVTSLVQAAVTTLTTQPTLMQPMAAPPLVAGDLLQDYTITETIVQGWLYKKGTGGDFSGRRWWKPRWVTLALAEKSNVITPLPILLSHRAPGVPYPASIMELTESTVIMAIERTLETNPEEKQRPDTPTKEDWNRHCFQIVHTHHQNNETTPKTTTRIFTAPAEDRNEWVFTMNNALMSYEKRLRKARSDAAKKEYQTTAKQQTKKARRGLRLDNQVPKLRPTSPWSNDDTPEIDRFRRMRSLSPVCGASMGLPPTSPIHRMRSPSPIRYGHSFDASSRSVTPCKLRTCQSLESN